MFKQDDKMQNLHEEVKEMLNWWGAGSYEEIKTGRFQWKYEEIKTGIFVVSTVDGELSSNYSSFKLQTTSTCHG